MDKSDEQSMYELGAGCGMERCSMVRLFLFGAVAQGFSDTIATRPMRRFTLRERARNAIVAFRIKEA